MNYKCPCLREKNEKSNPNSDQWIRYGGYFRKSDSRWIKRWKCRSCGKTASSGILSPCYRQNRRRLNEPLFRLLCSAVSLRRAALLLGCNRKTVARKFRFLANEKRIENLKRRSSLPLQTEVFFDEMETHEHSKWKPVSIALMVNQEREILGFNVSQMPARGLEARKAIRKYGYRRDHRPQALRDLFKSVRAQISPETQFHSDQKTLYPVILRSCFGKVTHHAHKGRRPCSIGQGELKVGRMDPLFPLNHTAAMLRYSMNRLVRKTWCTTKKIERLKDHIELYTAFHNQTLLKQQH